MQSKSQILLPHAYKDVYPTFHTVQSLETDWYFIDVKALSNELHKLDGISSMKMIFFKNIKKLDRFKMEPTFTYDDHK